MNRRGFLRAVGAAGCWLWLAGSVAEGRATQGEMRRRDQVATAIRGRSVLRFRYHGFAREVEPHALGTVKGGRFALLGWQVAGGSRSEPPPGWRTFLLADLERVRVLKQRFEVRPDYQRDRAALKTVEVEVTP